MQKTILIVDDEETIRQSLGGILVDEGYEILMAESGEQAVKIVEDELPNLVFLDIWLPGMDGLDTLKAIKSEYPSACVVMMSGHGTIETAVKATKLGAFDFIEKPLSLEKVVLVVNHALDMLRLEEENKLLRQKLSREYELTGNSPPIRGIEGNDLAGGADQCVDPHYGGKRHRQRAGGPFHSQAEPAGRQTLH